MRRLALLAVLGVVAAGCGGSGDEPASQATTTTSAADASGCREVPLPAAKRDGGRSAPAAALDPATTYRLTFATNCGSFTVTLDLKGAPKTSASLVSLARSGFYDHTIFHRIVPGFVIQGGDPTQSGSGGPGYSTVDKPPADTVYTKGVVAMAKTAAEPPGTSGSQFFVVTVPDAGLPPDYAVVGKVTSGLEVVERIGELGGADQRPTRTVEIEKVTVSAR